MKTRIISAVIMLAIFIPCLFLSDTVVFDIFISLLSLAAVFEMLGCIKYRKVLSVAVPSYIIALILPLCVRLINTGLALSELMLLVFTVYLLFMLSVSVFSHRKHSPQDVSIAYVMIFYIILGFSSILAIRNAANGQYIFLLIFIAAWISDTGAYFTGVFFGKRKLIPDVSPKKTVEGAIGGLVCCVVFFLIYGLIMQFAFKLQPHYILLAFLGLILSLVSMCGDLIASLIKRHYRIKDYGNLIPGHGGIMDRFDSIIAVASVMYVLLNIPFIGQKLF